MTTLKMNVSAIGGTILTEFSGNVTADSGGNVTVDSRDGPALLRAGGVYVNNRVSRSLFTAPRAGTAGRIVASASLANGTLTIGNQPDVPRQVSVRAFAGTVAITAGTLTFPYTANDGSAQVDVFSMVTAASAINSQNTTKGVAVAGSPVITGLTGGASPGIQLDDLNFLACTVEVGYANFVELREQTESGNQTFGTLAAGAGCISPSIVPNAAHNYDFMYSYTFPDS